MIRKITTEQLRAKMGRFMDAIFGSAAPDKLVLVDIRQFKESDLKILPKGVSIPLAEIEHRAKAILSESGVEIVVYGHRDTPQDSWRAAELLEISHRALLYKLKDYGIDADAEGEKGVVSAPQVLADPPWLGCAHCRTHI